MKTAIKTLGRKYLGCDPQSGVLWVATIIKGRPVTPTSVAARFDKELEALGVYAKPKELPKAASKKAKKEVK